MVQGVLPTAGVVARLILAVSHVLPEVDYLLGGDVQTDGLSNIFEAQLTVLVVVKPVKQVLHLVFVSHEAPEIH